MRLNALSGLAGALIVAPLSATTIQPVSLDRLIELSELILQGKVVSVEAKSDAVDGVVTEIGLRVDETLKGGVEVGTVFRFRAWGGRLAERRIEVEGEASYAVGDPVVVQLTELEPGVFHTLGLAYGKWDVVAEGGVPVLRRDLSGLGLVDESEPGGPRPDSATTLLREISLSEMTNRIRRLESDR